MEIAAIQWTSLQDFPDRVAAVLWTPGCNLRCPFCYNAELVLQELRPRTAPIATQSVLEKLRQRRHFLDGVVVTGGEPTLQTDLSEVLRRVKDLGLAVKLDTNGTQPRVLARLLAAQLVDYVALDIKAPPGQYASYTHPTQLGEEELLASVHSSLAMLKENSVNYELRTTAAPGLSEHDLQDIARWISPVERYFLQPFVCPPEARLIDEGLRGRNSLSPQQLQRLATNLSASRTSMIAKVRA